MQGNTDVPWWIFLVLSAAIVTACFFIVSLLIHWYDPPRVGFAGRRRVARGLGPKCGYDLRMTPDRCPECGTAAVLARPRRPRADQPTH